MKITDTGRTLFSVAVAGFALVWATPLFAQSSFEKFAAFDADSSSSIDYAAIDQLYSAVTVSKGGRRNFRYDVLRGDGKSILDAYTRFLTNIRPTALSRDEQLAYWLNLRNLLVVRSIAADGAARSLKRARGDFDDPGEMWTRKRISVEDVPLSIDDIEKHIILANWNDPDVIYGLYQGVKGGPAFVPPVNFTGQAVKQQLKDRGVSYVNMRRTLRVRNADVRAAAIFEWYKDALFAGDDQQVIAHLKTRAEGGLAEELGSVSTLSFAKMNYNVDQEQVRQQRQFDNRGPGVSTGSGS